MSEAAREQDARARLSAQTQFDRPLVLEAGAGTGKTAALVARVIHWCLGPGWERAEEQRGAETRRERLAAHVLSRVAAITFTEAAAAEMGQRVAEALEQIECGSAPRGVAAQVLPGTPVQRAERAAALRAVLDQLRVQTIHAFCRRLLAEHPLEAGLHPDFAVDADESAQKAVVRQALEAALPALFADSRAMLRLARAGFGPSQIEENVWFLLRNGVSLAALRADPFGPEAVAELVARFQQPLAMFVTLDADRLAGLGGRAKAVVAAATGLARLHQRVADGSLDLAGLLEAAAAVDPTPLKKWAKADFGKLGAEVLGADLETLAERAAALLPFVTHLRRIDVELMRAGRELLIPLYTETLRELRARGIETFSALLCDARNLLRDAPSVRGRVQRSLDQLLVDEFQDTDPVQCEIVRLLALDGPVSERPGLFLVGDPKQSIYGWRNADLAAYERFVEELRAAGGEVASLVVNYRSTPAVLDEVSRLFAPTLVHEPGVQPRFEVLLPAPGARDAEFDGDRASSEYWVSWRWDAESGGPTRTTAAEGDGLEAAAVAADIAELGRAGTRWKDIGLLFRAGTGLETYLAELRRAGIPFAVEGDRSYFERREIIEAGAMVRCVLDPNDHLALLTLLRSAVVGVPDAALVPLWARDLPDRMAELYGAGTEQRDAIDALVTGAAAEVPGDVPGIERIAGWADNLRAAARALGLLREAFDHDPADVFIEKLRALSLFEVTESARYLGAYRLANLDRFFRDLNTVLRDGEGDPQAILRALREDVAERREAEEGRPREAIDDAVQVMTIHKAKGLDFQHVYVLQLHKGRGGRVQPRVELCDGRLELELFGAPSLGYDRVEARRVARERAEQVRTLYVAATRAKQRLVLAGVHREHAARPGRDAMIALLERRQGGRPDLQAEAARFAGAAAGSSFEGVGTRWVFPALRPPVAGPRRPRRTAQFDTELVRASAASLVERRHSAAVESLRGFKAVVSDAVMAPESGAAPGLAGEAATAAAAGTLVHAVLERLDLRVDPAEALAAARTNLPQVLAADAGLPDREAALARASQVIDRIVAGPLLERLREIAGHVVARELDVLLPPSADGPAGFTSGAIDLVYRDPTDGAFVVADYKTDRIADRADLVAKARHYAAQGESYVAALREALGLDPPPRFELWFLDAGEIVTL
jgi:ATP-dependent helicase/nuclease subunit A